MSINREMDKEDVVQIYNAMLLSYKKEHWGARIFTKYDFLLVYI